MNHGLLKEFWLKWVSEWVLDGSAEYLLLNLHRAPSVMICEITQYYYGPYSKGFNNTSLKNPCGVVQIEFLSENSKYMLRKVKGTPLFLLNICLIPTTRQHWLFYKLISRSLFSISVCFYQELTDKSLIFKHMAGFLPAQGLYLLLWHLHFAITFAFCQIWTLPLQLPGISSSRDFFLLSFILGGLSSLWEGLRTRCTEASLIAEKTKDQILYLLLVYSCTWAAPSDSATTMDVGLVTHKSRFLPKLFSRPKSVF